jgi:hypothetical protein
VKKIIVIPVLEEDITVGNNNSARRSITGVYSIEVSSPFPNAKAKHIVES